MRKFFALSFKGKSLKCVILESLFYALILVAVRVLTSLLLGIGSLPDAVLSSLKEKNDLGIHSEMFSDGVMELVRAGVINNTKKALHKGKMVATFIMGTKAL